MSQQDKFKNDSYASIARYYDLDYQKVTDDIPFYSEIARQAGANPRLLELGCGTGRLTLPLARAGFNITGLDYSEAMLTIAQQHLTQEAPAVQQLVGWQQADMRDFDLGQDYDLIFIALNSFQHLLTQSDQLRCLQTIRRHLAPVGLFIIDVMNAEEKENYPADGRLEYSGSFDNPDTGGEVYHYISTVAEPAEQLRHYTYFYDEAIANGNLRRTISRFSLRLIYRFEMELLLAASGFAIQEFYGSHDFDEYGAGSNKLIYVCRRK